MRVAVMFFIVRMLMWAFAERHNGVVDRELDLFLRHLAFAVFLGAFLWVLYVALEPFVRKKWPHWIISWSRLLAGDYRDPLVGRDLLIGSVAGAAIIMLSGVGRIAPNWIGQPTPLTNTPATPILQAHLFFNRFAFQITAGLFLGFICVFLLLLFVAVLRNEMVSLIALGIIMTIMGSLISDSSLIMLPFNALSSFIVLFVMRRYGLLALCASFFVAHLYVFYPITTELTAWYAIDFTIALVICVVLAVYAAYTAVGGAKVFAEISTTS